MDINLILLIVLGIISFVELILGIVIGKKKNLAETMDITEDQISKFMIEAEEMKGLSGEEKKEYVMRRSEEFLKNRGLNIPVSNIGSIIEKIINLTKKINK